MPVCTDGRGKLQSVEGNGEVIACQNLTIGRWKHDPHNGPGPALYVESEIEVELEMEIMTARAAATARNNEILKNHFLSSARFRSVLPHYVTKKEMIEINEPCSV